MRKAPATTDVPNQKYWSTARAAGWRRVGSRQVSPQAPRRQRAAAGGRVGDQMIRPHSAPAAARCHHYLGTRPSATTSARDCWHATTLSEAAAGWGALRDAAHHPAAASRAMSVRIDFVLSNQQERERRYLHVQAAADLVPIRRHPPSPGSPPHASAACRQRDWPPDRIPPCRSNTAACAERVPERHTVTTGCALSSSASRCGSSAMGTIARRRCAPTHLRTPRARARRRSAVPVSVLPAPAARFPTALQRSRSVTPRSARQAVEHPPSGRPQRRLAGTAIAICLGCGRPRWFM